MARATKQSLMQVCIREFPDTKFLTDLELCEALSRRYEQNKNKYSAAAYITQLRKSYAIGVGYTCCKGLALGFRHGSNGSDYVSF